MRKLLRVFLFMGDEIKKPNPRRPVIRLATEHGPLLEANEFVLGNIRVRFSKRGNRHIKTHTVRAWVEFFVNEPVLLDVTKRCAVLNVAGPGNSARGVVSGNRRRAK